MQFRRAAELFREDRTSSLRNRHRMHRQTSPYCQEIISQYDITCGKNKTKRETGVHAVQKPKIFLTRDKSLKGGTALRTLDKRLRKAGNQQCAHHPDEPYIEGGEGPAPGNSVQKRAATHLLENKIANGNHAAGISPPECEMAVRDGPLRAVRIEIDLGKRHHESPNAGADKISERFREHPVKGRPISGFHMLGAGIVDGMDYHAEQRQRLERREESAHRQPVLGRPDPEIMMAKTKNPGAEHQGNFDIKPCFNDPP